MRTVSFFGFTLEASGLFSSDISVIGEAKFLSTECQMLS